MESLSAADYDMTTVLRALEARDRLRLPPNPAWSPESRRNINDALMFLTMLVLVFDEDDEPPFRLTVES